MVYWLKKLIGSFISPIRIGLGFLVIGLWIHWRGKRRKTSRTFIGIGILIPVLAFNSGVADLLNRQLEHTYPAIPVARNSDSSDIIYLAVLGGGHVENPQLAHLTQLVNASRSRVVESVRLARLYPDATLLMCGPQGDAQVNRPKPSITRDAISSDDRRRKIKAKDRTARLERGGGDGCPIES